MATVQLLRPTNMLALDVVILGGGSTQSPSEIEYVDGEGRLTFSTLGSFTLGLTSFLGPMSVALTYAQGRANMFFTGLAVDMTPTMHLDLRTGEINDVVAQLLSGSDTIIGSAGADTLAGFAGDDILIGGAGGDSFVGDAESSDTASYRTSTSGLVAALEDTGLATGDAAGDSFVNILNLEGSAFGDTLYGDDFANRLSGGAGDDMLVGKRGGDSFVGGSGIDTASYDASAAVRADLLNPSANVGAVGDTYTSIENLDGSPFDDILLGNNNANVIRGRSKTSLASGNDKLYGRGGNDTLEGLDGDDLLDGGSGTDTMRGGTGNDRYYVDSASDVVVELAGGGTADRVFAAADYVLSGLNVETLSTSNVLGTAAIDLTGNAQANTLYGNAGNNILDGRAGSDTLRGFGGADSFVFRDPLGPTNVDTIIDFSVAQDTIRLENVIFNAIVGMGTLSAGQFVANVSGTAQDANDRIIYETDTGKLIYDSNGSAVGGAVQFGLVSSGLALTNADFFVV